VPQQYKRGIDSLIVEVHAQSHPEHDQFFTLGECVTETYLSDFDSPDTVRSSVVLYYGSFRALAQEDWQFDWEREINDTLLHELQHHLEHLASEAGLEDFDYAVEENFRRVEGEPFDPLFYHAGEPIEPGYFRVEHDVFLELEADRMEEARYEFDWVGGRYLVSMPPSAADVQYVVIEEEMPDVAGDFCIVRIRRRSMLGTLRAALDRRGYTVEEVLVNMKEI
jgi:hypothetical protein